MKSIAFLPLFSYPLYMLNMHREYKGYLYFLPAILLAVIFSYYPFIRAIIQSNYSFNISSNAIFIGASHYKEIFNDPMFYDSLQQTIMYALLIVPISLALSVISAIGTSKLKILSNIQQAIFILPMCIAMSSIAIIIIMMFEPTIGLVNNVFNLDIQWLESKASARFLIVTISIWMAIGLDYAIIYAYITSIPQGFLDVAKIEGVNSTQLFWQIQMPIIWPALLYVTIINTKSALLLSGPIIILTNGGPNNSTQSIISLMYQKGFVFGYYGYSSALSFIGFILTTLIVIIVYFLQKKGRARYV